MKHFKEFIITAKPFNAEILSGILWTLDIDGITEEEDCLKVYADKKKDVDDLEIVYTLQQLVDNKLLLEFKVEEHLIEQKNWNKEWEKGINVIRVSDKIIIKPTFKKYKAQPGEIVITIDSKMSFGTGEHQTTKLVLNELEKEIKGGEKILDVGSGSAILSIAAIKLGAESAMAIDNDEWCYDNAWENAELNVVVNKIDIKTAEIKDVEENDFDLIIANIQKNVLLEIADEIIKRVKQTGKIILSGLLESDEKDITEKYEHLGFELINKNQMDEWIVLVFQKFVNKK